MPAAVANGASDATIIFRHILPNMTSTLLVQATLTIPAAIIGEAVLSFLGLGVQPPTPSWGMMLQDAQSYLTPGAAARRLSRARDRARRARVQRARRRAARHPRSADDALMAAAAARGDGPLGPLRHRRRAGARRRQALVHARRRGEVLGIVGESGCGKSVTCMSLVRLLPETARDRAAARSSTASTCSRCRRASCARSAAARSRSSSRSR